jgi:hypothetical protein
MAEFYDRRDMQSITTFTDTNSLFDFKFEAAEQLVINESNVALEVSFDGQNVHARLPSSGPASAINWSMHFRKKLYVRRASGVAGSPKFVQVIANTR